MEKNNAIIIYKFILENMNGWSKEEVKNLEFEEFEFDPIFEDLKKVSLLQ